PKAVSGLLGSTECTARKTRVRSSRPLAGGGSRRLSQTEARGGAGTVSSRSNHLNLARNVAYSGSPNSPGRPKAGPALRRDAAALGLRSTSAPVDEPTNG